ncbi:MAG TPA: 50S ribosomal protein L25 [Candidatus Woesebacteria bacterium]|nr:50S ribosomal protein L25 [Candidatus Woesebacteria bacterium]HOG37459.1 50S ribosomal protein L25 [Candidatus Woesebacteria bacterium]
MTKEKHQIKAAVRTVTGRKVKQIRKEGWLPATVYGKEFESLSIQFNLAEIVKLFDEIGESTLVEVILDEKEKLPVLFRNPQYHPIDGNMIHIDCYKVNLKEKIKAMVPIELVGESQAVKDGNILVTVTDEIEVEGLPADLPEKIEVDLSALENLESTIIVADLKLDSDKLEILTDGEQLIAKVEEPKAEEAPVVEEANPEDVEVITQKEGKDEEGTDTGNEEGEKEKEKKEE